MCMYVTHGTKCVDHCIMDVDTIIYYCKCVMWYAHTLHNNEHESLQVIIVKSNIRILSHPLVVINES